SLRDETPSMSAMPRKRRLPVKASPVAMGHKQKFDKALPVSTLELRGLDLREYEGPWRLAKSARVGPPNRWGDWVERLGKRISLMLTVLELSRQLSTVPSAVD